MNILTTIRKYGQNVIQRGGEVYERHMMLGMQGGGHCARRSRAGELF